MNLQEIYDKVANHLLTQNAKAQSMGRNGFPACMYRGDDGRKCAVGCLIADEHYSPHLENKACTNIDVRRALKASGIDCDNQPMVERMLIDLQYVHDRIKVEDWRAHLNSVALNYGLKP